MTSLPKKPIGLAFIRDTAKLGTAAALSQGFVLLSFPVIARMYAPGEVGEWGSIVAISGVCAAVAGGRLELAVPTTRPSDRMGVATVAFLLGLISTSLLMGAGATLNAAAFSPFWIWIGPITIALYWNTLATNLALAQERFSSIAIANWLMVGSMLGWQLIPKAFGLEGEWLFWGSTAGPILSGGYLLIRVKATESLISQLSVAQVRRILRRHGRMPRLLAPAALLNASALNLPVPLTQLLFGREWAGVLTMTLRTIGGPLALVGQAAAHVYFSRASILLRSQPAQLDELYRRLTSVLLISSLVLFPAIAIIPDSLYAIVLGNQYRSAAPLLRVLLPVFAVQFFVAPVAITLTILKRESWQLLWDLLRLMQAAGSIAIPAFFQLGISETFAIYSATGALAYLLYDRINRIALRHLVQRCRQRLP
jgi:lipopolysaccharide exporter